MTERYDDLVDAGAEVLAIAPAGLEKTASFARAHGVPFPCLADPDRQAYASYEVESTVASLGQRPALFVVDRDGVVRYAHIGWQQWEIPRIDEVVALCRRLR